MQRQADQNPFAWDRHAAEVVAPRAQLVDPIVEKLLRGEGVAVLGGRGMGKSLLLSLVADRLSATPGVCVVKLDRPPLNAEPGAVLRRLAEHLDVEPTDDFGDTLGALRSRTDPPELVVLLFDELDQYARDATFGRPLFNHLESVRRSTRELAICTAGGLGTLLLRDHLGSDFLSRASEIPVGPFSAAEIELLAEPLAESLEDGTLDAIRLATGGNPALVTFALQHAWPIDHVSPAHVADFFEDFAERHHGFIRSVHEAVMAPRVGDLPAKLLAAVRSAEGRVSRQALATLAADDLIGLGWESALTLLRSAGLVVVEGSTRADPVAVRPNTSILNLPERTASGGDLRTAVLTDLTDFLRQMHVLSPDFLRQGNQVVPEATLCAFLCMGLRERGWRAEREAIHGAGRTDLKLSRGHGGSQACAVVEVKIWPRNDYLDIQDQLAAYASHEVAVGIALMFRTAPDEAWAADYRTQCLPDERVTPHDVEPPLVARFEVTPSGGTGATTFDHLLFAFARR